MIDVYARRPSIASISWDSIINCCESFLKISNFSLGLMLLLRDITKTLIALTVG